MALLVAPALKPAGTRFDVGRVAQSLYGGKPGGFWKRLKFRLRCVWFGRAQREWTALLTAPPLAPLAAKVPSLFEKLHRPYVHRQWAVADRLAALLSHYRWLAGPTLAPLRSALVQGPVTLATLNLDATPLRLDLSADPVFNREGELVISLDDGVRRLGSIALVRGGGDTVWIGALQGATGDDARERYRDLTRVLEGVRPKNLLLIAAQQLARAAGAQQLRGIGNAAHVYSAVRYRNLQRVQADYDEFWGECGGEAQPDGSYALPLRYVVLPRESVPSRKRAMYERRRELLAGIEAQIQASLAALGLTPGA